MDEFLTLPTKSSTKFDTECLSAANRYVLANSRLNDKSFWGLRMTTSLNLFLLGNSLSSSLSVTT